MSSLEAAQRLYSGGRLREAGAALGEILRRDPGNAAAMQLLGVVQFQSGYRREGMKLVQRAVEIDPANADAWDNLGLMRHLESNQDAALLAFQRATEADPSHAGAWKHLGFLYQVKERHLDALDAFQHASGPDVSFLRGNSYAALGYHEKAIAEYDAALAADPGNVEALHNRGNSFLAIDSVREAVDDLQAASRMSGQSPLPFSNLAAALHRAGRPDEALAILEEVLRWDPTFKQARQLQSEVRAFLAGLDETGRSKGVGLAPSERATLARSLQEQGKWSAAIESLAGAKEGGLRLLETLLMPAVFESKAMADEALHHLDHGLSELENDPPSIEDPLEEVGITTFHLPYFGVSDRPYQQRIAELFRRCSPGLRFQASHSAGTERIRLGVVSGMLHHHTISRVFAGLLERLDEDTFERVFLQIGRSDAMSDRVARAMDRHVRLPSALASAREQIAEQELDLIFYPEIGMDPLTYYLAFSRLAPVQATTWGHPFTTGSPVIDHFISCFGFEREDGQSEYTEKLNLLTSIPGFYARPVTPPALSRSDFGLPETRRLYGCPQMAYKFHPGYDRVLWQIMEGDDEGLLVLIEPQHPRYKEILMRRWETDAPGLAERVIWLKTMALGNFLRLLQLCDCLLAPILFGGGRSSYDAFGVGAPVVTFEGSFLKSRVTAAMYRQMKFEDVVADTEDAYVSLAHRLAKDPDWRRQMRKTVADRAPILYESASAAREFNDALARLARP